MADEAYKNAPATIIARRHPEYIRMFPKWKFWFDSYMSPLDEYSSLYLFKNDKEGDEEFETRRKRAYRENHSKRVVDLINTYLFKEDAVRNTDNKFLKNFFENADGKGKSLSRFMKNVSLFSSMLGRVYIVVDKMNPEVLTGTHKDNLDGQVYCYMVLPTDVLDIAFNDDGSVKWALIKEVVRDDDDPFKSSCEMVTKYRLWHGGDWFLFDDGGNQVESGTTNLDVCPIIAVNNEETVSEYHAPSLISDVSYLDRAIFNNYSRLDVIVNDQTFSQLIFPIEGAIVSDVIDNEDTREKFLTMATNRILFYASAAGEKPEFISPDASQAEFILSMIKHQTKQLYACMGLQNESSQEATDQSGIAKSYDFDKLNKLLASKADNLELAEMRLLNAVKQWRGINTAQVEVDYPDEFDVKSLNQEILIAQELALLDISEKFIKEINKRVVMRALPKLPEDLQKAIFKEIDEKTYDPLMVSAGIQGLKSQNAKDESFSDKKGTGKKGGRLGQSQDKADQMT